MNDYGLNAAAYTTAGDVLGYYRALDRYAYRAPNMEEAPGLVGVPTQDTERTPIEPIIPANELGTTVMLATHDKEVINSLKRRVITLEKGKMVRDEKRGRYVL